MGSPWQKLPLESNHWQSLSAPAGGATVVSHSKMIGCAGSPIFSAGHGAVFGFSPCPLCKGGAHPPTPATPMRRCKELPISCNSTPPAQTGGWGAKWLLQALGLHHPYRRYEEGAPLGEDPVGNNKMPQLMPACSLGIWFLHASLLRITLWYRERQTRMKIETGRWYIEWSHNRNLIPTDLSPIF